MYTEFKKHLPEYLMEATGLGIFMLCACFFGSLLEYPGSPVHQSLPDPFLRRMLMGVAMGLTAICLIYSPWGKQSGAHLNPSVTLTFLRLGKVAPRDALFYILAQFIGGAAGVLAAALLLGAIIAHPSVNYVVTTPGTFGIGAAFAGEAAITFLLMTVVLHVSNSARLSRFTGLCAGALVALYITLEAPISGMSMNPARTLASALPAQVWTSLWIYFTAPPLGMLLAAQLYLIQKGRDSVSCAKLHHDNTRRCIFCNCHLRQTEAQSQERQEVPMLSR
jgi:aquaporin Z